jgi:hypothetical protein
MPPTNIPTRAEVKAAAQDWASAVRWATISNSDQNVKDAVAAQARFYAVLDRLYKPDH